ncbi:HEL336Cp [Eremothecium sinecaudum]|uniref:non-specific serine/threonine protein kinase n=1 Tax=Eremothecium sinecaudum TaxID=45286 RepID=A0A0X8HT42_9SACH|nr:HEL336Cp [Eremothecium sinecaudum]AMD20945.1 HEL336Cp [Eremothecium sinecaudum]
MSYEHEKPLMPDDKFKLDGRMQAEYGEDITTGGSSRPVEKYLYSTGNVNYSNGIGVHGGDISRPEIGRAITDSRNFIFVDHQGLKRQVNNRSPNGLAVSENSIVSDDEDGDADDQYSLPLSEDSLSDNIDRPESTLNTQLASLSVAEAYRKRHEEWAEKGSAKVVRSTTDPETGKVTKQVIRRGIKDFKFGEALGDGSYSTVVLATCIESGKKYAAKILNKEYLIKQKKVKYVNIEKNTLQRLNSSRISGIIKLYFTFQDEANLYFILEYAPNGDLLSLMKKYNTLNEDCTRYYGAQILDAISHLHKHGIVHRDIKPENILLDKTMKVKLTDFGTAKLLDIQEETKSYDLHTRSKSFVGTAEYVSPELLNDNWVDHRCDIWALGCILFQMIAGKPPFKAANEYLIFQKVMKVQYAFSAGFPMAVRDLVKQILVKNPDLRLSIPQIRKHPFFAEIDFENGGAWSKPAPELSPYKVTSKAMQALPSPKEKLPNHNSDRLKKNLQNIKAVTSTPSRASNNSSSSHDNNSSSGRNTRQNNNDITSEVPKRRPISSAGTGASSAAFAALYKRRTSHYYSKHSSSPVVPVPNAPHSAPTTSGAVPNTPFTFAMGNRSTTTATETSAAGAHKKNTTPAQLMNATDIFWSFYLTRLDERVLKTGELKMAVIKNQALERKVDRVNAVMVDTVKNLSKGSLLSQVVRNGGHNTGFRNVDKSSGNEEDFYKESTVNWEMVAEEYKVKSTSHDETEVENNMTNRFKRLFSGLRSGESNEIAQADNYQQRMLVLTTYARLLVLVKTKKPSKEVNETYEQQYEINIDLPGIHIKEVTSENQEYGTFVIQTPFSSFVFNCPHGELSTWIETFKVAISKNSARLLVEASEHEPNPMANTAAKLSTGKLPQMPSKSDIRSPVTQNEEPPSSKAKTAASANNMTTKSSSSSSSSAAASRIEVKHERLFDHFVFRKNHERPQAQPVPHSTALLHGLPILPPSSNEAQKMIPKQSGSTALRNRPKAHSTRMFTKSERSLRR